MPRESSFPVVRIPLSLIELNAMTRTPDSFAILADNGTLTLWDYDTGTPFQNMEDVPQPGSLEAEAGVFCSTFDATGTRLITGGADKTIKVENGARC
jgi:WD40 repeat protein